MPSAHPPYDMLRAYAAGTAGEGVALLVAAHATWCPACRAEIARIEALGAALMRHEAEAPVTAGALEAVLARLDDAPPPPAPAAAPDAILPRPLREALGAGFRDIRWRFVMPGVSRCDVPVAGPEQAMLLRVRPGAGVPAHTHTGEEATLVLSGALSDRGAIYRPGDVSFADGEDDHLPRAEPGADCVCFALMSGSLRFTGRFGRALNLFAE